MATKLASFLVAPATVQVELNEPPASARTQAHFEALARENLEAQKRAIVVELDNQRARLGRARARLADVEASEPDGTAGPHVRLAWQQLHGELVVEVARLEERVAHIEHVRKTDRRYK